MKITFAAISISLAMGLVGGASCARASEQPRAFDAVRLRSVHDHLLADYPVERKKLLNTLAPSLFYLKLATALEDAGVRELLDDGNAKFVPVTVRIAILNDYGFWLSKTDDPRKAVLVLQNVVELVPTRAVTELNLADAAQAAVPLADTWEQKNNFSAIGLQAYAAYRRLSGKEPPAANAFEGLRVAASNSKDVCSYVATFYNHGRQADMWGYPDPVDIAGDGKLRHVYLFDEGTAHVPVLFASTKAVPEEERSSESYKEPAEVDFNLTKDQSGTDDSRIWHDELHVLPFKEGYYVVYQDDGGPFAVVKPNAGTVCQFKRKFTPVLAEDHAPAICKEALAGTAFNKIPDQPLPSGEIRTNDVDLHFPGGSDAPDFLRYSDVMLDPKGALARIGYYEYSSGAGAGCGFSGIAFLDGKSLESSMRANALIEALSGMPRCHGSTAFLVETNGENLIEWDAGQALQRNTPPRALLRLRADKVETVCRVDQRPTYIPVLVVEPR
jgi:hypothetical protein